MHNSPYGRKKQQGSGKAIGLRTYFQWTLKVLLAAGLLLASPGGPQFVLAQAQGGPADRSAEIAALFEELRGELDRTQFDLEALGFELAFEDAETIVGLVRERIAFEQYPGLLRGAQGTLISGAGNALDQAVLLAILLGDAGYDVRIARGNLTAQQAEELLMQMEGGNVSGELPLADAASLFELDETEVAAARELLEAETRKLTQDADGAVGLIERELQQAGIELAGTDISLLLEEARDYFWVEYRLGDSDSWTAAHTAFAAPPASLASTEPLEYLTSEIPAELQHRFRFEVFIEQRLGTDLEVRPVMSAWERPAANMTGVALTYTNAPDGLLEAVEGTSPEDVLAATDFFIPLFNGNPADGSQSFDMLGNSLASEDAAAPAAGLFQSVGGLFGAAAGLLADEENPEDFVTLTAQWLEYTLIAPGGAETTHRRTVFDRIGTSNRTAGVVELSGEVSQEEAQAALATTYTFMVAPGHYSAAYVMDRSLAAVTASFELVRTLEAEGGAAGSDSGQELSSAVEPLDHLNLFASFDNLPLPAGVSSYRHEPNLVVIESGWAGGHEQVDVISNSRRTLQHLPGRLPVADPGWALRTGVWETRLESLPIAATDALATTFRAFATASAGQGEIVTLTAATADRLAGLNLPPASIAAMKQDLADGYVVITPASPAADEADTGWWRVHATTGETLGRGGDGRGNAFTEYATQLQVASAVLSATRTLATCVMSNNVAQYVCCLREGAVVFGLGFILGSQLSALTSFIMIDLVAGGALLVGSVTGWMPSACSIFAGGCSTTRA